MTANLVQIGGGAQAYHQAKSTLLNASYARTWTALRPMYAHVYVENRCHLSCAHCYESEETHPGDHRLEVSDYERIFDQLADLGVLVLTLSGGEPFLRKDFLDIVALARRKRFAVRIYTSGTPITAIKADEIAKLKVSEVHVSLYSHLAEKHDAFTGQKGSWALSVRAIRMLRARGVHVTLKANILRFNVDELDELIEFARGLDADYSIDPTVKPRMNGDTAPLDYTISPEQIRDLMLTRPDLAPALSGEAADRVCNGENARDSGGSMCAAARGLISIGADGSVSPCAVFPVSGGNAMEDSVLDIWQRSPLFERVRQTTMNDMSECGSCDVRGGCTPCMAYGLVEHDDHKACSSVSRQFATARKQVAERVKEVGVNLPATGGGRGTLTTEL